MTEREENILSQFNRIKSTLLEWGKFVDRDLLEILDLRFVKEYKLKIPPSFRLKDDKSFISKALWRKKEYQDPLFEIEDKIGTRLVMLSTLDVENAAEEILSYKGWNAKVTKRISELKDENPEVFSYQSIHIVVWPLEDDSRFDPSLIRLLTCEVQIRTLLQHAYAEISHDSTYKGSYKNDKSIIRHLAKSMALMEATDDYFCEIYRLMADETRFYQNYTNELVKIYKYYNENFQKDQIDLEITDYVLGLLSQKEVSIQQLEEFLTKRDADVKKAINAKNGLLFQQPISILVSYYFFNHRTFLNTNWPLNLESLKAVYKAFNTTFDYY